MNIGHKIRDIRKEKKMTLQQLADIIGCSPQLISQYENGKRIPKIETLRKIAKGLKVNPSDLIEYRKEQQQLHVLLDEMKKIQLNNSISTLEKEKLLTKYNFKISELHKEIELAEWQKCQLSAKPLEEFHQEIVSKALEAENELLNNFRQLNTDGKEEARKRVAELTEIKRYTEFEAPTEE